MGRQTPPGQWHSGHSYEPTIAELYEQVSHGNQSAENELIVRIMPKLKVRLQQIIWEPDVIEDILQDTLIACLIKVRQQALKTPESFSAYAASIGKNLAYQYIRRHKKDKDNIQFCDPEHDIATAVTQDHSKNPDAQLEEIQTRHFVSEMLNTLPRQRDQDILVSYYLNEHQSSEICSQNNIRQDHLYRVLSRARQRLRRLMSQQQIAGSLYFT